MTASTVNRAGRIDILPRQEIERTLRADRLYRLGLSLLALLVLGLPAALLINASFTQGFEAVSVTQWVFFISLVCVAPLPFLMFRFVPTNFPDAMAISSIGLTLSYHGVESTIIHWDRPSQSIRLIDKHMAYGEGGLWVRMLHVQGSGPIPLDASSQAALLEAAKSSGSVSVTELARFGKQAILVYVVSGRPMY